MPKLDRLDPDSLRGNRRASLPSWLKYQDIVLAAFRLHPQPYTFRPQGLSPLTVATRLRDAIRGALAFGHPCEIPQPDLLRWYSEVIIKSDESSVYVGPPPKNVPSPVEVAKETPSSSFSYDSLSFEEVAAFAVLLSSGRVRGPVEVRNPPDLSLLPERQNVEFYRPPTGGLVIL